MSNVNRHGLRRGSLTAAQKRILRQEAGFGCVICGKAIGEYHHIDPAFEDARCHDVNTMVFLCTQCHRKVSGGHISVKTVVEAKHNPFALRSNFSFEAFDVGDEPPTVHFGPLSARNCKSIIRINGRGIFWISSPECAGGPFRLNALMTNAKGVPVFSIVDNEWRVRSGNWDAEVVGQRIFIRNGPRCIALMLRTVPPGDIFVEKIDMLFGCVKIYCDEEQFVLSAPNFPQFRATEMNFIDCDAAVDVEKNAVCLGVGVVGGLYIDNLILGDKKKLPPSGLLDLRRNAPCPCGSGSRYKNCCGSMRAR